MSQSACLILLHLCLLLSLCVSCAVGTANVAIDPVPIDPPPGEPRCARGFERDASVVLARQGVPSISTYFPEGEAREQLVRYPGRLCPAQALRLAVGALLTSDVPESVSQVGAELGHRECDARCYVDRRSSLLGLVTDRSSRLSHQLLPPAPNGDRVEENWVFFLSVPDLSEHGYWAVVARDGSGVEVVAQN